MARSCADRGCSGRCGRPASILYTGAVIGILVALGITITVVAVQLLGPEQYKVAFTLDEGDPGNRDIAVVNLDGSGLIRVASDPAVDEFAPQWAPDGSQIAYGCGNEICVTDARGQSRRTLTSTTGSDRDSDPSWSPDGESIVFSRYVNPGSSGASLRLMTVGEDGQGLRSISLPTWAQSPSWSPDGTELVFALSGQEYDIWKARVDGSSPQVLFEAASYDFEPQFSPDGGQIVFACGGQICVMNADGSDVRAIADGGNPRWHPDGVHILAACSLPGQRQICQMKADGTEMRVVFRASQGEGYWPDPSPEPLPE